LSESGTPADKAIAGISIRKKLSCPAAINLAIFYGIEGWRSQAPDPVNFLCGLGVLREAGG